MDFFKGISDYTIQYSTDGQHGLHLQKHLFQTLEQQMQKLVQIHLLNLLDLELITIDDTLYIVTGNSDNGIQIIYLCHKYCSKKRCTNDGASDELEGVREVKTFKV